ncbi:MAG: RipA family octameric membrane protein [Sphingomicrobium sp.]
MSETAIARATDHAWRYFELHAHQRVTVFNYYIVFAGIILAGLAASLQRNDDFAALGIALGVLLVLLSWVFWQLDRRAAFLVKHAERALETLEVQLPIEAQLFRQEPEAPKPKWHWTYGRSFRFIFLVMSLVGLAGAILAGLQLSGQIHLQNDTTTHESSRAARTPSVPKKNYGSE